MKRSRRPVSTLKKPKRCMESQGKGEQLKLGHGQAAVIPSTKILSGGEENAQASNNSSSTSQVSSNSVDENAVDFLLNFFSGTKSAKTRTVDNNDMKAELEEKKVCSHF